MTEQLVSKKLASLFFIYLFGYLLIDLTAVEKN